MRSLSSPYNFALLLPKLIAWLFCPCAWRIININSIPISTTGVTNVKIFHIIVLSLGALSEITALPLLFSVSLRSSVPTPPLIYDACVGLSWSLTVIFRSLPRPSTFANLPSFASLITCDIGTSFSGWCGEKNAHIASTARITIAQNKLSLIVFETLVVRFGFFVGIKPSSFRLTIRKTLSTISFLIGFYYARTANVYHHV